MAQAITRLFDDYEDAAAAVRNLEQAGISPEDISLVANNAAGRHLAADRPHDLDDDNDAAEGAAKGATTGGLIGGGAGLLAGLGMLAIPGLGPVVAAGWLASTAIGAVIGAAAGGATGGLLGALKDAGHSDDEAQVYAEGVRRGGALVSVKPRNEAQTETAIQVLDAAAGVDAVLRGREYRERGWQGYDPAAPAYGADEIAAERVRYREARSFEPLDRDADDLRARRLLREDRDLDAPADRPADPTLRDV
jgi:hypothetical protein